MRPARVELGGWKPTAKECHGNVSTWCQNTDGYSPVRGWLYFDFDDQLSYVRFVAHSVVRDAQGILWDITPQNATQPHPFNVAEEAEVNYQALIESGITSFDYQK